MQFTSEQVKKFKLLYKRKFGIELSDQDVIKELNKLISLVQKIYKPITIDQYFDYRLAKLKKNGNKIQRTN
ncbi:MAG: hypothetical protein ACOCUI_04480 [bacterium]